jgi:allophanate hydrolase subunit 2
VDVPPVLGSRSTCTLSGLGPPPLREGDRLGIGRQAVHEPRDAAPPVRGSGPLRVLLGPRDDALTARGVEALLAQEWTVTAASDRTGLRLAGTPLERREGGELASEGVVAGSVQVPPDGRPVLFLANHPTTGGYPVVAVVVRADLGQAAQAAPGDVVRLRV